MYCIYCGTKNNNKDHFCIKCGKVFQKTQDSLKNNDAELSITGAMNPEVVTETDNVSSKIKLYSKGYFDLVLIILICFQFLAFILSTIYTGSYLYIFDTPQKVVALGDGYLKSGKYDSAIAMYKKADKIGLKKESSLQKIDYANKVRVLNDYINKINPLTQKYNSLINSLLYVGQSNSSSQSDIIAFCDYSTAIISDLLIAANSLKYNDNDIKELNATYIENLEVSKQYVSQFAKSASKQANNLEEAGKKKTESKDKFNDQLKQKASSLSLTINNTTKFLEY